MKKQTQKFNNVINDMVLDNFERVSQSDEKPEPVITKPQRDPRASKDRDMRKLSKKERWND
mgnify:CR=1 FL=1